MKFGFLSTLFLLASITWTGCRQDDPCENVECVYGFCADGTCMCFDGFEGQDCASALNAKFSGTYTGTEACTPATTIPREITLAPNPNSTHWLSISGLTDEAEDTVEAYLDSDGTNMTIYRQPLGRLGYEVISSNATSSWDGKTITLSYDIYYDTTIVKTCTILMTK